MSNHPQTHLLFCTVSNLDIKGLSLMCNQTYKYTIQRHMTGMQEEQTAVISIEEVAGGYIASVEVDEGWYTTTPSSDPDEAREKGEELAREYFSD